MRSLVLTAEGLHDGGGQLELWPDAAADDRPKDFAVQRALDRIWRTANSYAYGIGGTFPSNRA